MTKVFDIALVGLHELIEEPKCAMLPDANAILEHNNRLYRVGWGLTDLAEHAPDTL